MRTSESRTRVPVPPPHKRTSASSIAWTLRETVAFTDGSLRTASEGFRGGHSHDPPSKTYGQCECRFVAYSSAVIDCHASAVTPVLSLERCHCRVDGCHPSALCRPSSDHPARPQGVGRWPFARTSTAAHGRGRYTFDGGKGMDCEHVWPPSHLRVPDIDIHHMCPRVPLW